MSLILRQPRYSVTLDGVPLTSVVSLSVSAGFDRRTSEARVTVVSLPATARPWQRLAISAGASDSGLRVRFSGFYVEPDYAGWPYSVTLVGRGPLVLAELARNGEQDGTSFANASDEQIVDAVLAVAGVTDRAIGGTGTTLGSRNPAAFVWAAGQSALDFISQLDEVSLGYRTFDSIGGTVLREPVTITPAPAPSFTFTEGVDIVTASSQATVIGARNRVVVEGADLGGGTLLAERVQDSPFLPAGVVATEQRSSAMIERAEPGDAGPGLSCGDVATWIMHELNRQIVQIPLETKRDDLLQPGMTIRVNAPNRLSTDAAYWVQGVDVSLDASGGFVQRLTCIGGPSSSAPVLTPPRADFTLQVETEVVLNAGVEGTLTVAFARDTSVAPGGTITARAWGASTGGNPATGTDQEFNSGFVDPTNATITLTVTDSNGLTATRTKQVRPVEALQRVIITAEGPAQHLSLFDGAAWKTQSVGIDVNCCGNAPIWGAGDRVYRSVDHLATPAPYSVPRAGDAVVVLSAVLGFMDVAGDALPSSTVTAGLASGRIAVSRDGAQTWQVFAGPTGGTLISAGASPYDKGEISVTASNGGWHMFGDSGNWVRIFTPNGDETVTDAAFSAHEYGSGHASHWYALAGGSRHVVRAEDGATLSFPNADISSIDAVCEAIGIDRVYCIDDLGRCYISEPVATLTLIEASEVPAPGLQPFHPLQPDGGIEGILYGAFGSAGAAKSIDSLRTAGGWYWLRVPGEAGCPSSAVVRMIGFGELVVPNVTGSTPPPDGGVSGGGGSPILAYSNTTTVKALSLWSGSANGSAPVGWQNLEFDDSGWAAAVATGSGGGATPPSGSTSLWSSNPAAAATEQTLFRQRFALPLGIITSATLRYVVDDEADVWINGVWVAGDTTHSPTGVDGPFTVTFDATILRPGGTNIIAVLGRNYYTGAWAAWTVEVS